MRVVVCALGGFVAPGKLPVSSFVDRTWIYGGERTLYELAAAVAALGFEVELRGDVSRQDLEEICEHAGGRPNVGMDPRRPARNDLVILPEGLGNRRIYAAVALSPARAVMMLLGPPGLFGPALREGWVPPDPLKVDVTSVGRPEHFRAIASLGFELWSNAPAIGAASLAAGVPCSVIGTGQPIPFPPPGPKTEDVVYLESNRWAPLARRVVKALGGRAVSIPEGDRGSVLRRLASARVLILPARIEGQARLQIEARAVGTVPVTLRSNRFAARMGDDGGTVVVESVDEMPAAINRLLADSAGLEERAARAVRTARAQADWGAFVSRVKAVMGSKPDWEVRSAGAFLGQEVDALLAALARRQQDVDALRAALDRRQQDLGKLHAGIGWLRGQLRGSDERASAMAREIQWLRERVRQTELERDAVLQELHGVRSRRSVRLALWAVEGFRSLFRSKGEGRISPLDRTHLVDEEGPPTS
jgi:hypothetical protein